MEFIFEGEKQRLDKFLVKKLLEKSRSQIQKMIKEGLVLVNNKKPTPHHFLKVNDTVEIPEILSFRPSSNVLLEQVEKSIDSSTPPNQTSGSLGMTKKDAAGKKLKKLELKIIFEDKNILIIDKPAGLLVHARDEKLLNQEPTVAQWLLKNHPAIKEVGDNTILRPGIVHRLDKETSGVMAVAKTNAAFENLKEQFKKRGVKKEYLAWVYGKLPTDYGIINFPIGRSEEGGRMAARPFNKETLETDIHQEDQESKEAITEYEVLESHPHRSLLKVFPKTGRTHQIRAHFFALNHPLIGDPLYKSKSYKEILVPRLLLHAHKLTLTDLDGAEKTFESKIPKEFKLD